MNQGRTALALLVVVRRGDEERGRLRIYAGSGAHVRVGPHAEHEGFRIPLPGVMGFGEIELFAHQQGLRSPDASPWHLLRVRSSEVGVSFTSPPPERDWHPAGGFPGDWCALRANDSGTVTMGPYVIEFSHEGFTPPETVVPDSTAT